MFFSRESSSRSSGCGTCEPDLRPPHFQQLCTHSRLPQRRRYRRPSRTSIALPLPEDRGEAALEQTLRRLGTTASVMMIVAHPDDEDGALLTYLSPRPGRACHASARSRAAKADRMRCRPKPTTRSASSAPMNCSRPTSIYGAKQLWGTEADFGFSKTQEEAFAKWGHDRVLYDAVLAVRRERPAGHRLHLCRRHHRRPRPAPGLRRDRAGGLQGRRRPKGLSRNSLKDGLAALATAGRLLHGSVCAGH